MDVVENQKSISRIPTGIENLDANIGLLLKKFAEKSRDVFWVRSADYQKQLFISPSFDEIWGFSREVIYNNPKPEKWISYIHPDDLPPLEHSIAQRTPDVTPDTSFLVEFRIIRPDGEIRWIRDESFPIFDDKHQHVGFAGISQDITKAKAVEEAEQMAKIANQSKSEFLANMSHDLRTPLNWLLGSADILNKRNSDPEKAKLFEMLLDGGKRILHMVEEVLDYSKLESGNLPLFEQPLNLQHCLEDVVQMMSADADKKDLPIILKYGSDVTRYIISDIQRIRRIAMNLLSNALKFTQHGVIMLQVSEVSKNDTQAMLQITVEDTGIGIPDNKIHRIFDRFTRVENKNQVNGSGLGLAIVKNFIDAMGGTIEVTSRLKQGTSFKCILPFTIDQQAGSKSQLYIQRFKHVPILIIDDLRIRAESYAQNLLGEKIVIASGKCALETFQQGYSETEPFKVVIIDDGVSGYSDAEIARSISALGHDIHPLLISCSKKSGNESINHKALQFHTILPKPLLPSKLPRQLSRAWVKHASKYFSDLELVHQFGAKVLLVEDEPFGQKIVSMLLEEELQCSVDIANNAEEGLQLVYENEYDLILMDVGLPDESGLSLTRKIRRLESKHESTYIVALTAHASDDMIVQCRQAGMNGHLAKPASIDELLGTIIKSIRGQVALPTEV